VLQADDRRTRQTSLAFALAVLLLVLPVRPGAQTTDESQGRFAIHLLDTTATAAEPTAAGEGRDKLVGEDEIEAYDWDNQVLILAAEASQRVQVGAGGFVAMLGRSVSTRDAGPGASRRWRPSRP
jgi:hypothetical protein